MAWIDIPPGEGTEVQRVWSLVPELKKAEDAFRKGLWEGMSLPLHEQEVARVRIAQLNDCHY